MISVTSEENGGRKGEASALKETSQATGESFVCVHRSRCVLGGWGPVSQLIINYDKRNKDRPGRIKGSAVAVDSLRMPESGKLDLIMESIQAQRLEKNKVGREINHEDIPNTYPTKPPHSLDLQVSWELGLSSLTEARSGSPLLYMC